VEAVADPTPFNSNDEYLDSEFAFLSLRCARLDAREKYFGAKRAEENGGDPCCGGQGVQGLRRLLEDLESREAEVRSALDARLAAHRKDGSAPPLGIDQLCSKHGVCDAGRLVLLALAVPALSPRLAQELVPGGYCGRATTADLVALLAPANVADWQRGRKLFRPNSPLVQNQLVLLDYYNTSAETLLGAGVELSLGAFSAIFGDEGATSEVPATE